MHHPQDGRYTASPQHFSQRWSLSFSPTLPNPISSCLKASTWRGNSWLSQRRSSSFLQSSVCLNAPHYMETWCSSHLPPHCHWNTHSALCPRCSISMPQCPIWMPSGRTSHQQEMVREATGPKCPKLTPWPAGDICTKIWGTSVYVTQITALPHSYPLHDWKRDTDILPMLSHILTCFVFPFTFSKVSPIGFGSTFHFWLFWPLFCALFFS